MKHEIVSAWIIITSMLIVPACSHRSKIIRKKISVCPLKKDISPLIPPIKPPFTVWIHGTRLLKNSTFKNVFESKAQLQKINALKKRTYLKTIAETLCSHNPAQFSYETFYVFGWSAKLKAHAREQSAYILYEQLLAHIEDYKQKYGATPYIRMITHSHGGNIALNLAKVAQKEKKDIIIDELVLLACPVQLNTQNFLKDPLFKKVYAFYSSLDFVQVLAPQIYHKSSCERDGKITTQRHIPIFSGRQFPEHTKLIQAKIRMNGRGLFHNEFIEKPFLSILPRLLTELDTWQIEPERSHLSCTKSRLLCVYTQQLNTAAQAAHA